MLPFQKSRAEEKIAVFANKMVKVFHEDAGKSQVVDLKSLPSSPQMITLESQ